MINLQQQTCKKKKNVKIYSKKINLVQIQNLVQVFISENLAFISNHKKQE